MNFSPLKHGSALLFLTIGLIGNAAAQVGVFWEDAEGYAVAAGGESIRLPSSKAAEGVNWWSFSQGGGRTVSIERDSAEHFGRGEQNHSVVFTREKGASHPHNLVSNHFEPIAAGQLAFDFYTAPGQIEGSPGVRVLLMNTSVDYAQNLADYKNNAAFAGLFIADGHIRQRMLNGSAGQASIPFESGRAHRLAIVFNNTSAPFAYANGRETLAAGDMDIWLDGEKKATWPLNATAQAEAATRALRPDEADALAGAKGLWFNSNAPAVLELDNIRIARTPDAGMPSN